MGLIGALLTLPLAPVRAVAWVGDQVRAFAEQETDGPRNVSARLAEIAAAREAGDITPAHAADLEQRVLDDLLGTETTWTDTDDSEVWIGRQP